MTPQVPALTHEELKRHEDFVYRCVMDNTILQSSAKFGRELKMSIQDLVHSSVTTLKSIGQQIEKVAKEAGSSEFTSEGPFKINGVEASKWIEFLKLQIRLTQVVEAEANKRLRIKELEAQIDDLKTPEEKRKDLEKEYNHLMGIVPQPIV